MAGRTPLPNSLIFDKMVSILEREILLTYPAGEFNLSNSTESPREFGKI
ncbi:6674_t:CDS:1, partial [Rhizophagus irregularis]